MSNVGSWKALRATTLAYSSAQLEIKARQIIFISKEIGDRLLIETPYHRFWVDNKNLKDFEKLD